MGGDVSGQHLGPRVQHRHRRRLLLTTELRLVPCGPSSNLSQGTEPSDWGGSVMLVWMAGWGTQGVLGVPQAFPQASYPRDTY